MSWLRAAILSDLHRWTLSVSSPAFSHPAGLQNLWKSPELALPPGSSRPGTNPKSLGVNICQESQS